MAVASCNAVNLLAGGRTDYSEFILLNIASLVIRSRPLISIETIIIIQKEVGAVFLLLSKQAMPAPNARI